MAFQAGEQSVISVDDGFGRAVSVNSSMMKKPGAGAELLDPVELMGDENDRLVFFLSCFDFFDAASLEGGVSDGKRLVDEEQDPGYA